MGVPGPSTNGTIPVVSPPRDRPMSLVLTPPFTSETFW